MMSPGLRRAIDAIERTPLAVPMAALTAGAAAFLAFAVPAAIVLHGLARVPALAAMATPFGAGPRAALMLAAALIAGGAADGPAG